MSAEVSNENQVETAKALSEKVLITQLGICDYSSLTTVYSNREWPYISKQLAQNKIVWFLFVLTWYKLAKYRQLIKHSFIDITKWAYF